MILKDFGLISTIPIASQIKRLLDMLNMEIAILEKLKSMQFTQKLTS
jgi:hypothetical protein